jgi:hypothetical protein
MGQILQYIVGLIVFLIILFKILDMVYFYTKTNGWEVGDTIQIFQQPECQLVEWDDDLVYVIFHGNNIIHEFSLDEVHFNKSSNYRKMMKK